MKQSGTKDWSVGQDPQTPVKPREIFRISGWLKSEGGICSISVVSRDDKGTTLQWDLGAAESRGAGWQFVRRGFVIPSGCATIQFRFIGYGAGQSMLEDPSLMRVGTAPAPGGKPIELHGKDLKLAIRPDGSILASPSKGKAWQYRPWDADYVIRSAKAVDGRTAAIEALDLANDLPLSLRIQVDPDKPEATVAVEASGPMQYPVAVPGSLVTEPGQWVVLPMNEGIRFPVEDGAIDGWSMITYGGHGLCMPWSGVMDPKTG